MTDREAPQNELLHEAVLEAVQNQPKQLQEIIDEMSPRFNIGMQHVVAAVWDLVGEPGGLHYGMQGWVSSIESPRVASVPKPVMVMRSLRVPLKLWEQAKAKADEREENLSDAIREFLEWYVARKS